MNESPKEKPFPKSVIIIVIAIAIGLVAIFAVLATIGDDVPTKLPPATETSPGN